MAAKKPIQQNGMVSTINNLPIFNDGTPERIPLPPPIYLFDSM
jgi:hypothetical protein